MSNIRRFTLRGVVLNIVQLPDDLYCALTVGES
jgi:hypothetical protein